MGILGSGTKTAYDAEFTESVQTLEHTKKFMEKCIAGIQNSIKVCLRSTVTRAVEDASGLQLEQLGQPL